MNIDHLTYGELKQIAAVFSSHAKPEPKSHPMAGRYVIVRTMGAGVHAGVLESLDDGCAVLREARRLWRWQSASPAVALSGVAMSGLGGKDNKIDVEVPSVCLTSAVEIIPCTAQAEQSIRGWR